MGISAAIPITALQQRQIIGAFRTVGALTGASAKRLRELNLNESKPLRLMVASGLVRKAGDRYFLDEGKVANTRNLKWKTVWRLLVVLGLGSAAAALYSVGR